MGDNQIRHVGDVSAIVALLGWANNMLPAIATLLTIIWTGLRCYEAVLAIRQKKAELRQGGQRPPQDGP